MSSKSNDKTRRVNACIRNKVNFISGTITPCQSNKYHNNTFNQSDIESLDIGLKYLFNMYSNKLKLSIQPKYMGSRLNMYLFKDDYLNKSYCVTRNGFKCNGLCKEELEKLYTKMYNKLKDYMIEKNIKMIIIDGELMPWSAIGSTLIDEEFMTVDAGLKSEIEYMKKYNFDDILMKQKEKLNELSKEHTSDEYKKFKSVMEIHNTETMEKMYNTYHSQMELYSKPISDTNCIDYKPFGILKICYDDDSEDIPLLSKSMSQSEMYNILCDKTNSIEDQLIIELTDDTYDNELQKIKEYFKNITMNNGYEGIMLKPDYIEKDKLHMMKCRNIDYLTIIYGYDYMIEPKLTRLIKSKTTGSKIKQSINEFNSGMKMLQTKYNDINTDNIQYQRLIMKYLFNEELGQTIDPRL